jgi:6-phosphofructokinase 1
MKSTASPAVHPQNVLYAQAGGPSAVINASATAVIEQCRRHPERFGTVYAAINGIKGVLEERLVDTSKFSEQTLAHIQHLPGAAFEACRFDLDPMEDNPQQYQRVLEVFKAYEIGYFFYNGGNGSMLTAQKVADYCSAHGHPVTCIGVAKTIDNDLALSHCSPGFGSAAKYLATSLLEATLDLHSMHNTSTRFFVMEAMGRNAGWLALAGGLVKTQMPEVPLIILPAERPFNREAFLNKVEGFFDSHGYCSCIVSEGLSDENGAYLSIENVEHTALKDYTQLGGVAHQIARLVSDRFGCKTHAAVPDYLQRAASHLVSATDWEMAYGAGQAAVEAALAGEHGVLPVIQISHESPFRWHFANVSLTAVADLEKRVPDPFISEDGMDITQAGLTYLLPLIQGERSAPFSNGLPVIQPMTFQCVSARLPAYREVK